MNRKKADQDYQLLANRIALLKAEEEKAQKKIDETDKRASEVIEIRKRNEALAREKEERRQQREREIEEYRERARSMRVDNSESVYERQRQLREQKRYEAAALQDAKDRAEDEKRRNLEVESSMLQARREQMQQEEDERRMQQQRIRDEKKRKAKEAFEEKCAQELLKMKQREEMIAQMEAAEMELIKRLHNTQQRQRLAYENLESALQAGGASTGKTAPGKSSVPKATAAPRKDAPAPHRTAALQPLAAASGSGGAAGRRAAPSVTASSNAGSRRATSGRSSATPAGRKASAAATPLRTAPKVMSVTPAHAAPSHPPNSGGAVVSDEMLGWVQGLSLGLKGLAANQEGGFELEDALAGPAAEPGAAMVQRHVAEQLSQCMLAVMAQQGKKGLTLKDDVQTGAQWLTVHGADELLTDGSLNLRLHEQHAPPRNDGRHEVLWLDLLLRPDHLCVFKDGKTLFPAGVSAEDAAAQTNGAAGASSQTAHDAALGATSEADVYAGVYFVEKVVIPSAVVDSLTDDSDTGSEVSLVKLHVIVRAWRVHGLATQIKDVPVVKKQFYAEVRIANATLKGLLRAAEPVA